MASWSFGKNFKEDNSKKKLTATEKEFLGFLLYQYGDHYIDDISDEDTGECEWYENLSGKLE